MGFPDDFWWGTAASSTQCEGAAPASDWSEWERRGRAPEDNAGEWDILADHRGLPRPPGDREVDREHNWLNTRAAPRPVRDGGGRLYPWRKCPEGQISKIPLRRQHPDPPG